MLSNITLYILLICVLFIIPGLSERPVHATGLNTNPKGCNPPYALPNLPFFVVWNVPSQGCEAHGIDLNLQAYGIVTNDKDRFMGDNMVVFYGLGDWPLYRGNQTHNGGIPQEGNLSEHLRKAIEVLQKSIPKRDFQGLAVIDFEAWRPLYNMNFDSLNIYQTKSLELVKKKHPSWTDKAQILQEAIKEWNTAARYFMETTVQLGRQKRPNGYWGYYGMPRCWGNSPSNQCPPGTPAVNDEISWLWKSSTALFPRIYTHTKASLDNRYRYVRQTVNESLRVQAKWMGLETPIMPYTLNQDTGTDFFQKKDLQIAIEEPAAMGASGTVIWGSSHLFHTKNECYKMQADIKNVLGPFVKNLTKFTTACATDLCHHHGRCVRKDYERATQNFLRLYQKDACKRPVEEYEDIHRRRKLFFVDNYSRFSKYDDYVCRCITGWSGEYCNKSMDA